MKISGYSAVVWIYTWGIIYIYVNLQQFICSSYVTFYMVLKKSYFHPFYVLNVSMPLFSYISDIICTVFFKKYTQ
jgi:hypothetical protein